MYIDHSKPPFIDIALPPAIILPLYQLIILYSASLFLDFFILCNEHRLQFSNRQLRLMLAIYHIAIPLIFTSSNQPFNILLAGGPWFLSAYSAQMSLDKLTLQSWFDTMMSLSREENTDKQYTLTKRRVKGAAIIALGVFKLAFNQLVITPLLPNHPEYALDYPWLHPMSWIYTFLFGVQAYCFLGAVEVFLGLQQLLFGWKMVELNNYPVLSSSPRDFWSRRWNNLIRKSLHTLIFAPPSTEAGSITYAEKKNDTTLIIPQRMTRSLLKAVATEKKPVNDEQSSPLAPVNVTFWSTRRGRGLLVFLISGVFHELIIMSTCRRITLENFAFFLIEGVLVMLEVDLRQGVYKQQPTGTIRITCILFHLLSLAIIGRLFTGPYLRYGFFSL